MSNALDDWLDELSAALAEAGLPLDRDAVDRSLLLDVARDAAHGVARPAAPLTTFVVGLAAGAHGGDADAVRRAAEVATRLAAARTPAED